MPAASSGREWSRAGRVRRTPARARQMVVAGRREAAEAALGVFEDGGNACDAIVAAAIVTAVVDPVNVAFGGSGYLLLDGDEIGGSWSAEFPARAPGAASPGMFDLAPESDGEEAIAVSRVEGDLNRSGPLACGVPALPAGLLEAQARWGRLALGRVLEPAIELAHTGFPADVELVLAALENLHELRADAGASEIFLRDGLPPVLDPAHPVSGSRPDRVLQPQLGRTLEVLARAGTAGWRDDVAPRLAADLERRGGIVTAADLQGYRPQLGRPFEHRIADVRFLTTNAPSGGWTVLQLLALRRRLGHAADGSTGAEVHRFVEASRHAFADRYAFLGDPPEVDTEVLLSDDYLGRVAEGIADGAAGLRFDDAGPDPWVRFAEAPAHDPPGRARRTRPVGARPGEASGTAHLLAGDADGTLACCTITAGEAFGSKVLSESTGVLLDNAMLWFDARPGFPNSIEPGKRPLTNMAPVIAVGSTGVRWAAGAAGGRRIPSAVAQVLLRALGGAGPQEALDWPRVDASGRNVLVDADLDERTVAYLEEAGHPVLRVDLEHAGTAFELARPSMLMAEGHNLRGGYDARSPGYVAAIA